MFVNIDKAEILLHSSSSHLYLTALITEMILVIIVQCLEEASDKICTKEIMLLNDDDALDGGDDDGLACFQ